MNNTESKDKFKTAMVLMIMGGLVFYLTGSFGAASFNIAEWPEVARWVLALIYLFFLFTIPITLLSK